MCEPRSPARPLATGRCTTRAIRSGTARAVDKRTQRAMRTGHSDISAPRALVLKPTQIRAGTAHAGAEASRIPHRHVGVWHSFVGVDRAFVCARALCHCVGNHRTLIVEDSRVLRVCDSDHPCGQVHGWAARRLSEQQRRWVRRREPLRARAQRGRSEQASECSTGGGGGRDSRARGRTGTPPRRSCRM